MTERPILFSAPMVRAILAGTKTQARRLVTASTSLVDGRGEGKAAWRDHLRFDGSEWVDRGPSPVGNAGPYLKVANADGERRHRIYPRVQPGDLLWVKETHASTTQAGDHAADARTVYRATDPDWSTMPGWKWKPSIFMRRAESRIALRVTGVRVERVQDISNEDIVAEGAAPERWLRAARTAPDEDSTMIDGIRAAWEMLWIDINGRESWHANPWVWVVDFEVAS